MGVVKCGAFRELAQRSTKKKADSMCRSLLLLAAFAALAAAAPSQTPTKPTASAAAATAFDDAYDLYDEGVCANGGKSDSAQQKQAGVPPPPAGNSSWQWRRCASVGEGAQGRVKRAPRAPPRARPIRTRHDAPAFLLTRPHTSPHHQPTMMNPGSTSLRTRCVERGKATEEKKREARFLRLFFSNHTPPHHSPPDRRRRRLRRL